MALALLANGGHYVAMLLLFATVYDGADRVVVFIRLSLHGACFVCVLLCG